MKTLYKFCFLNENSSITDKLESIFAVTFTAIIIVLCISLLVYSFITII